MLPRTPFAQFISPRLHQCRLRLQKLCWQDRPDTVAVSRTKSLKQHVPFEQAVKLPFEPVTRTPFFWGPKFHQCWWKLTLNAPAAEDTYLHWHDQAEATLYTEDGMPWYGMDPGHHRAPVPAGATTLYVESSCQRTGIWVTGEKQGIDDEGSRFTGVTLADRNESAWRCWNDLDLLIGVTAQLRKLTMPQVKGADEIGYRPPFDRVTPEVRLILHGMDRCVDAFENGGPEEMAPLFDELFEQLPASATSLRAVLTGHAHLDLVWLWPEAAGDFKAVHLFATNNWILENHPEVRFGYSQPASYDSVGRRSPRLLERTKANIAAGRWEATGALEVESDTQLPCGENLLRAMLIGQAGFRNLRGEPSRALWLPDVFGYSGALPQIMAECDTPYFFTTKLTWNDSTKFPHASFIWRGNDGSEVLSHVTLACGYNGATDPEPIFESALQHPQAHIHPAFLYPCGYGDGGGGVNPEMVHRVTRLNSLAGMPRCQWGTIEGFFDELATKRNELPVYAGEIYLAYHRGVQTTHGNLKAAFRAAERGLQVHEAVRCCTGGQPVPHQRWKRLTFAQFHDYIPGSSIQEVYDEHVPELEGIASDSLTDAASELDAGGEPCVFNPLPFERVELVEGKPRLLPPLAGVKVSSLEPLGARAAEATATSLSNDRLEAKFDAAGRLTSLVVDNRPVALAAPGNQLHLFTDHPHKYNAWDIDRPTLANGRPVTEAAAGQVRQDADGAEVRFAVKLGHKSSATVVYRLEPASPVLLITYEIDLQDEEVLLKAAFPTAYAGRSARYGAPFGSVRRPAQPGDVATESFFEVPASRWALVADDAESEGLMLLTEAKYGFGCYGGLLHVSLVRSALVTDAENNRALRSSPYPHDYSDIGKHTVRIALGRFDANAPRHELPAALCESRFTPPVAYQGKPVHAGLLDVAGGESLLPSWAKPEADGWTLRLHETLGRRGTASLRLADGYTAGRVDMLGRDLPGLGVSGDAASFDFEPYKAYSFHVRKV
ncbi:MAG: alpha-mannosidase [Phycisphaerae bacterium]